MWKKLDLHFDGIMSGFLGSKEQIGIVEDFIRQFATEDTKVIVDPVMGDHGKIAGTYTEEMCMEMRRLVSLADIITPNLTEACRLTDTPYRETGWKEKELLSLAEQLNEMGPEQIVITGSSSFGIPESPSFLASRCTAIKIPAKYRIAGRIALTIICEYETPTKSAIRNAAAPMIGGMICPPVEEAASTAPANSAPS